MKVKEAIKALSELNPEETIIAAWWCHDMFSELVDKEDWDGGADIVEDNMDWSRTHDTLYNLFERFVVEENAN